MKILILSSSSRHFPLDIQESLMQAGLEAHRLHSLNEFIASPLRKEPFLAILEVGTTEDIDRALVAYEWAETVQPLAAARYLLLLGSKHILLHDKASRFRGVEIAQLPLPVKNLMFKVELQLKVLSSEAKTKVEKKVEGFSAEIRGVDKQRVMVIRGAGPDKGGWKNSGEAPQGRIRWRWIDDPPKKGRPEANFSWQTESKTSPEFNPQIEAWEVKDPEADLQCHLGGKEIFSAKKVEALKAREENSGVRTETADSRPTQPAERAGEGGESKSESQNFTAAAAASPKNNLVTNIGAASNEPNAPIAEPAAKVEREGPAVFSGEKPSGFSPLKAEPKNAVPAPGQLSPKPEAPASQAKQSLNAVAPTPVSPPALASEAGQSKSPAPVNHPPQKEGSPESEKPEVRQKAESKDSPAPTPSSGPTIATKSNPIAVQPTEKSPKVIAPEPTEEVAKRNPEPKEAAAIDAGAPKNLKQPGDWNAPLAAAQKSPGLAAIAPSAPAQAKKPETSPPVAASAPPKAAPQTKTNPGSAPPFVSKGADSSALSTEEKKEPLPKDSPLIPPHTRKLRTEVFETVGERPADPGLDTTANFPDHTKEITGKIVIPTSPSDSDHQNLIRSASERSSSERNVISSSAKPEEETQALKTRLFLTLSLEALQDQNSTWMPVEGYRIYLSARHRYYGIRELNEVFPLWIYEGELAPEFLDTQKAWKFYDRLPNSFASLDKLPEAVARYLIEQSKAKVKVEKALSAGKAQEGEKVKLEEGSSFLPAEKTAKPGSSAKNKPAIFSAAWFAEFVGRFFGQ